MSKCVVLFVEGATEEEFYSRLLEHLKEKRGGKVHDMSTRVISVNGICNFEKLALRKFVKEVKTKYSGDCEFTVVLCYDTDVFEVELHPKVNWKNIKKSMLRNGAQEVIMVEARHSIEDWFLYDLEGIVSFLKLKQGTKATGKNGLEKLKNLYRKKNKAYIKGSKSGDMVRCLDSDKIAKAVREQLAPLYKALRCEL